MDYSYRLIVVIVIHKVPNQPLYHPCLLAPNAQVQQEEDAKKETYAARAVAVSFSETPPQCVRRIKSRLGPKRPATWWWSSIVLHHHQRPGNCK